MNKKERRLALATALQSAAGDVVVVDDIKQAAADGKTKSLVSAVSKVSGGAKKVLLVLSQYDAMVDRAGRNVENLTINVASSLQVYDVLNADVIVMEKGALQSINDTYGAAAAESSA
jgi:large subunit ribosomal protein L4